MTLEVSIVGAATLKKVAARMASEGRKDLSREMGQALTRAAEPVRVSIAKEADEAMPSGGGYRSLLSRSLRHRISRRNGGQAAQVILATYADGTSERRDIKALNRGILRHPVFGRSRRVRSGSRAGTIMPNPWAVTSIRSGFHDRGTARAMDQAQAQLVEVIEDFAGRLASG